MKRKTTDKTGRVPSQDESNLRKLARDIVEGRVFTDRQIRNPGDARIVFMVTFFGGLKKEVAYAAKHPKAPDALNLIYEYMSEAGPLAVNGMPIFMSARMLNRADVQKVDELMGEYRKATADFGG